MKKKLFQYAVLWHPKEDKTAGGTTITESSKILKELTTVLATDEKAVGILAARSVPEEYVDQLEQIEILVRPF